MISTLAGFSIASRLSSPGVDFDAIAETAIKEPEAIDQLFVALASKTAAVKYGAGKVLRLVSERAPELLYPRFDDLFRLFEGENTILRWGATRIIGNLAAVDSAGRIEKRFKRFFAPLSGREMIGAANVIAAAVRIAEAKPRLAARIEREILRVETGAYATPECRNVAIGHAIRALDRICALLPDRKAVVDFAARQIQNTRPATRRKAQQFLKRWAAA